MEKYRPRHMNEMALDEVNRRILGNIMETGRCPHLLFHGPPGTGKTTAAIGLTRHLQKLDGEIAKERVIHLNASDDRGVDTIRRQISKFAAAKNLFRMGRKFVILDEVDYMTRCAQMALRQLIHDHSDPSLCFCLICNYVTRIEGALRAEFVLLRFDCPPPEEVQGLLRKIVDSEGVDASEEALDAIRLSYRADVRSMINFLQCQHRQSYPYTTVSSAFWEQTRKTIAGAAPSADWVTKRAALGGMSVQQFATGLLNYLVRSGGALQGGMLLSLASQIVSAQEGSAFQLARFVGEEIHRVLALPSVARCKSRKLHGSGGEGVIGK